MPLIYMSYFTRFLPILMQADEEAIGTVVKREDGASFHEGAVTPALNSETSKNTVLSKSPPRIDDEAGPWLPQ